MTNWKGIQAYGCKKPDFAPPGDVNVGQMSMGSWHVRLDKGGKWKKSSGGLRKKTSRAKIKYSHLPLDPNYDKQGWRIH